MRTSDGMVMLGHLRQQPIIVSYILYGYLPVTVHLSPGVQPRDKKYSKDVRLIWVYRVCVGQAESNDLMTAKEHQPVTSLSRGVMDSERYMLGMARRFAKEYINAGRGVRGKAYVPDVMSVRLSRKGQPSAYKPFPDMYKSELEEAKAQLRQLKRQGRIGRVEQKAEEWLR